MNPLAIFTGPYALFAKWGVITLLVLCFGAYAWFKGNEHGTQKLNDYIAEQAQEAIRIARGRDVVTERVVKIYITKQAETKVVTQTVEKEVIK